MTNRTHRISRRTFFGRTLAGAAATGLVASRAKALPGLNEQLRLALIGCGGMGNRHLDRLIKRDDCKVVAVCDVWKRRHEYAVKKVGGECQGYQDFRHVLDRTDIDAIFCATPDHWHPLVAIMACQSGKDVYVEKPIATTVLEGRAMVDAARRYGRVMQVGIQQRSRALFQEAVQIVQSGRLGQITSAGAWIGPSGQSGPEHVGEAPGDLDWDLWLGPAPWTPYSPERHVGFHAFHDFGAGELANWGVHLLDVVHWGIDADVPVNIQATGGSYRGMPVNDAHENIEITYEFPNCKVMWEQRHGTGLGNKGYGIRFQGTDGSLYIDRGSFIVEPDTLGIPETFEQGDPWLDIDSHHTNFFECIRSRQQPKGDIEIGHRATSTCLLGAIALDRRRRLEWDGQSERFLADAHADRLLFRPYRDPWHL